MVVTENGLCVKFRPVGGAGAAMSMDFYDFFSGCGGTSQGMREAGMAVRLGIDWDPDANATYKENFAKAEFICKDIRKLTVKDVAAHIKRLPGRPIVFGACAPCQPFSKQNRVRDDNDRRRTLLREFHRFIRAFRPEYLFVENVPELHAIDELSGPFSEFLTFLDSLGYRYAYRTIMAYHYGVPQCRRRLILIASRLGPIEFPAPSHGPNSGNPNLPTVWKRISGLPPIKAGDAHPKIPNHRASSLSDLNLKRIASTPEGGSRMDWPKNLMLACHKGHSGHTDVYGRMAKDQPATALTTRCISLSNGRFGHPTQNRAISVREAACIQTFPMSFEFLGSMNSMARQVGNAVPVEIARIFGVAIVKHYRSIKAKKAA
jgi:DNA (cytosine-5)-methyltransferase 1